MRPKYKGESLCSQLLLPGWSHGGGKFKPCEPCGVLCCFYLILTRGYFFLLIFRKRVKGREGERQREKEISM